MKYGLFVLLVCYVHCLFPYAYLPDDMSMSKVLIAIAHNSSQSKKYGWRYYQQLGTIKQQWDAGARGGKINLHWRLPMGVDDQVARFLGKKVGRVYRSTKQLITGKKRAEPFIGLCHDPDGASNCFLSRVVQKKGEIGRALNYFKTFAQLLKENQNDVAIILLEDYLGKRSAANQADQYDFDDTNRILDDILVRSGIAQYAFKLEPQYYLHIEQEEQEESKDEEGGQVDLAEQEEKIVEKTVSAETWPTVGELRKSGKRVLIFIDQESRKQSSLYLNYLHDAFAKSSWAYDWKKELKEGKCSLYTQGKAGKFAPKLKQGFEISHGPESSIPKESKKAYAIEYARRSKIALTRLQIGDYNYINSRAVLKKRVADCAKQDTGSPPNVITLDFVETGDLYNSIKEINMNRYQKLQKEKPAQSA